MRKLILIIRILLITVLANAQQANNNFDLSIGTSINGNYGMGINGGLEYNSNKRFVVKSQFTAISNKAIDAPKDMTYKPKDQFTAMSLSVGCGFAENANSKFNFKMLGGISEIIGKKHSNFTAKANNSFNYSGNTALDILVILPLNLLSNSSDDFNYKTEEIDKIAFIFTPEIEFLVGANSKIAVNCNSYIATESLNSELNLLYKLKF